MLTIDDIRTAARRLAGVARRTPVVRSAALDAIAGNSIFFKCENAQFAGAFKFRGAYNALAQLSEADRERGVVTFSSGNHGQGIALAASMLRMRAAVIMPRGAPAVKLDATRRHGAEIVLYDPASQDRESVARSLAAERGALLVPPFDDLRIMAGQGTVALELIEEVPDLDVLLVPVGGGGLLAGCAVTLRALRPEAKVFGIEPSGADDWRQSWQRGERIAIAEAKTIADGLRPTAPGKLTWPIVRAHADGILTVSDEEIVSAMRALLVHARVRAEPSGAAAPAAALSQSLDVQGARVGVVISGGNVDPQAFADLTEGRMPTRPNGR